MGKVTDFLTQEMAERCAAEIVSSFSEHGNAESIEVDFNISKGKMVEPLEQANTWFKFDPNKGALQEVVSFLTELWRDDSTTEEDALEVQAFEKKIVEALNDGDYVSQLANILRERALGDVPPQYVPLEKIVFHRIEFAGEDEQSYMLKVQKFARVDGDTGEFVDNPQAVAQDLIKAHTDTGRPFKEIIEEKRLEGDSRYKYVEDAVLERYSRHVSVTMSADYSFCEKPAHESTT